MKNLRTLFFASMVAAAAAYGQNDTPYQIKYAANLGIGESYINISNTGASGASNTQVGTSAGVTGAICVNVYAFNSDEEIVSCCSCPVTPNGLVNLGAVRDLISNPLFPGTPTSIVIKLLATAPVGGSCVGSQLLTGTPVLANGMVAWGTTLHLNTSAVAGTYALTETPFANATLSAGEQARLAYSCGIVGTSANPGQGSGNGICASCRLGGLGGVGK